LKQLISLGFEIPTAMNNRGAIVGTTTIGGENDAVVWLVSKWMDGGVTDKLAGGIGQGCLQMMDTCPAFRIERYGSKPPAAGCSCQGGGDNLPAATTYPSD
jgi:hypothetical protein